MGRFRSVLPRPRRWKPQVSFRIELCANSIERMRVCVCVCVGGSNSRFRTKLNSNNFRFFFAHFLLLWKYQEHARTDEHKFDYLMVAKRPHIFCTLLACYKRNANYIISTFFDVRFKDNKIDGEIWSKAIIINNSFKLTHLTAESEWI